MSWVYSIRDIPIAGGPRCEEVSPILRGIVGLAETMSQNHGWKEMSGDMPWWLGAYLLSVGIRKCQGVRCFSLE